MVTLVVIGAAGGAVAVLGRDADSRSRCRVLRCSRNIVSERVEAGVGECPEALSVVWHRVRHSGEFRFSLNWYYAATYSRVGGGGSWTVWTQGFCILTSRMISGCAEEGASRPRGSATWIR